jgi:hypothetical protein
MRDMPSASAVAQAPMTQAAEVTPIVMLNGRIACKRDQVGQPGEIRQ